ncbi:zinc ribbon domain-containing protein [Planctomycetota bacterium]
MKDLPMTVTAEVLRKLHRIHIQLSDLNSRYERGPKRIKAGQATVGTLAKGVEEAKELVKRSRMTIDDKDLQLRERENRILDLKTKLNTASSNREYQSFVEQVAADEQANSVLSDEILELYDKLEGLQGGVAKAEENLAKCKTEFETVKKGIDDERAGLEADINRLKEELAGIESDLPSDFKADYDRIVGNRGEEGLAALDGECCGNCYQMITPQMQSELIMLRPVPCINCGAIMYLPESTKE